MCASVRHKKMWGNMLNLWKYALKICSIMLAYATYFRAYFDKFCIYVEHTYMCHIYAANI